MSHGYQGDHRNNTIMSHGYQGDHINTTLQQGYQGDYINNCPKMHKNNNDSIKNKRCTPPPF